MALSGTIATNHFSNSTVDETWMDFNWSASQNKNDNILVFRGRLEQKELTHIGLNFIMCILI